MNTQENQTRLLSPYFTSKPMGGLRYFKGLPLEVLNQAIESGLVDMNPWNDCPGMKTFGPFLTNHPKFTAHGYAVDFTREDHRITIEGLEAKNLSSDDMRDFTDKFSEADEFECSRKYARCWYD